MHCGNTGDAIINPEGCKSPQSSQCTGRTGARDRQIAAILVNGGYADGNITGAGIMGTFTVGDHPAIEARIMADMDIIREEIRKHIQPVALYLTGSFGRGEGTVLERGEDLLLLGDYDLLLVVQKKIPEPVMMQIRETLSRRLGCPVAGTPGSMIPHFACSLFQTTPDDIRSYANVGTNELQDRCVLICGEDIRAGIPLTARDIPAASLFHFLFHKTMLMIGTFPSRYLTSPPEGDDRAFLLYNCGKVYLGIGIALCLLGGIYRPGFAARNQVLGKEFVRLFPRLARDHPDLPDTIDRFTRQKLEPDPAFFAALDPIETWFATRRDLLAVLAYCAETWYGEDTCSDAVCLSEALYRGTRSDYFLGQFRYLIRIRTGINSKSLARLLNNVYRFGTALEFYLRSRKVSRGTLRVLLHSPVLRIFTLAPVLLSTLERDGSVDGRLMTYFDAEFAQIHTTRPVPRDGNGWDRAWADLRFASSIYERLR